MLEVGRHPSVKIVPKAELETIEEEDGNFTVYLRRRPRYVKEDLCVGCGTCTTYCPYMAPNPFDEGMSSVKAISILYPQAVPAVANVDRSACLYFQNKCTICIPVCEAKAIDLTQKAKKGRVKVGAIIVSPGYDTFDSTLLGEYGYGRFKDVVSSLEFERFLNADGPTKGEVLRPSDGKFPSRIAWLQCIGSRDTRVNHTYCSGVCCTYAVKQALLFKMHYPEARATIFHNDIRTYGKGFEDLYNRARDKESVQFVRRRISALKENKKDNTVTLTYVSDNHDIKEEEFDMVVLSVGLSPSRNRQSISEILGLDLDEYGFCRTDSFTPNEMPKRRGIFPAATFTGPMDIPDSISSVTGAVSLAAQLLSGQQGSLEKTYPEERSIEGEELKVGVFVCNCGTNIAGVVDVPSVVNHALSLHNVVHCEEQVISCSFDSSRKIAETIKEKGLNRVVVAACTPRTHEPIFQETLREAGLNKYLFEMANIREQCSWVHSRVKDKATQKAKDVLAMSVARARNLFSLEEIELPVNKKGLVLGGGVAGMKAALALAKQGFDVYLVEKESKLGGNLNNLHYTVDGKEVQPFLKSLVGEVEGQKNIKLFIGYEVKAFSGFVGNFKSTLGRTSAGTKGDSRNSDQTEVEHGVIIVATGGKELKPDKYRYQESRQVVTQQEFENMVVSDPTVQNLRQVVMIQCVGSRDKERPYCSRICCGEAIKNALRLKEFNKDIEIHILYRDMRTYGSLEDYYAKAREKGILFTRYEPEREPIIEVRGETLSLTFHDLVLDMEQEINPDLIVLSTPVISEGNWELSQLLKVPVTSDGFFMEAHMKLRPLDFPTDGIFLCGMSQYPKFIFETISQANGAAVRAATILSKDTILCSGAICEVKEEECVACGVCEAVCPYGAVTLQGTPQGLKARVIPALCKGCGICNAKCPTRAISLNHFTDSQIYSQMHEAFQVM